MKRFVKRFKVNLLYVVEMLVGWIVALVCLMAAAYFLLVLALTIISRVDGILMNATFAVVCLILALLDGWLMDQLGERLPYKNVISDRAKFVERRRPVLQVLDYDSVVNALQIIHDAPMPPASDTYTEFEVGDGCTFLYEYDGNDDWFNGGRTLHGEVVDKNWVGDEIVYTVRVKYADMDYQGLWVVTWAGHELNGGDGSFVGVLAIKELEQHYNGGYAGQDKLSSFRGGRNDAGGGAIGVIVVLVFLGIWFFSTHHIHFGTTSVL